MTSRLFSFPGLTLAATVQSLLAIKMFPSHYSSGRQLLPVVVIFLANYVLGLAFWCILYPVFISPLRHLPGPKVCCCRQIFSDFFLSPCLLTDVPL